MKTNKIEQRIKELEMFKEENNFHEGMFKGFKEALKLKDEEIKEKIKKLKERIPSNYVSFDSETESQGITWHDVIDNTFSEVEGK